MFGRLSSSWTSLVFAAAFLAPLSAVAQQPAPWQIGLQKPASPVMDRIYEFNGLLLVVIITTTVLVLALMAYVMFRFSAKRHPTPSKRTHNTVLEVIWTAAPILILAVILVPSIRLLYYEDRAHDAELTIKVIGHQWYWSYEYPDNGEIGFDSFMVPDDKLKEGQPRLLAVDNPLVLPVGTDVRILLTSDDVIHSWAVPSLGVKTDSVPGRVNETWVRIEREGTYYGQCSELCGVNHGFMPIEVRAVQPEAFKQWVAKVAAK